MPLLSLARFWASVFSVLVLATGAYLLWSWWQGETWVAPDGAILRDRDAWRLWVAGPLLALSFLGRPLMLLLLARRDRDPTHAQRGAGGMVTGESGAELYVETCGREGAAPIIFTHGWGMDSTFWFYARRDLSDRFRLILWDLPGMGRSRPGAPDRVNLVAFAEDLAGLLKTCGQPAVLVGHSIGGMTIQTLLRDHPHLASRIAGVVLLNTTHTNPLETMVLSRLLLALQKPILEPATRLMIPLQPLVWLSKWQSYLSGATHLALRMGFGKFVTRSQLEHVALLSARNPPANEARGNLSMFHWDAGEAARRLHSPPVLVVGGDLDIVTKLEASRRIAADHEGELQVVEGVNHMGPMERADLYNELIATFALRVQPSATADFRSPPTPSPSPEPRTLAAGTPPVSP
jgi:pimeloyl-ACP methyl ester carboxylesterase